MVSPIGHSNRHSMGTAMLYIRWKAVFALFAGICIFTVTFVLILGSQEPSSLEQFVTKKPKVKLVKISQIVNKPTAPPTAPNVVKEEPKTVARAMPLMQTIMYMEGWIQNEEFYNGPYNTYLDRYSESDCGYYCTITRVGEIRFAAADVVVFQPSSLRLAPPRKHPHQYWVLHAFSELSQKEQKDFNKNGYQEVIDYYMVLPLSVNTPMLFNKRLNNISTDGFNKESRISKYTNRHPPFNITQMVSVCELLPQAEYAQRLDNPLGKRLKALSSQVSLTLAVICYHIALGVNIPDDVTFVVLDDNDCYNSLLEQLVLVLNKNSDSIPIVPAVSAEVLQDLTLVAPPHSFISFNDFGSVEALFEHLKTVLTDGELFLQYHKWKASYSIRTKAGNDPTKSAICKFCQLGYVRPPVNQHVAKQKCLQLD